MLGEDQVAYEGLNHSFEVRRNRALNFVIVCLALTAVGLVAFFVGQSFRAVTQSNEDLYNVNNPVRILSTVNGVDGPAAFTDQESIETLTFSCLRAHDEDVFVNFNTTWQKINLEEDVEAFLQGSDGQVISPINKEDSAGCESGHPGTEFETLFPEDVVPGVWRFTSNVTITDVDGLELDAEVTVSETMIFVERK